MLQLTIVFCQQAIFTGTISVIMVLPNLTIHLELSGTALSQAVIVLRIWTLCQSLFGSFQC